MLLHAAAVFIKISMFLADAIRMATYVNIVKYFYVSFNL